MDFYEIFFWDLHFDELLEPFQGAFFAEFYVAGRGKRIPRPKPNFRTIRPGFLENRGLESVEHLAQPK